MSWKLWGNSQIPHSVPHSNHMCHWPQHLASPGSQDWSLGFLLSMKIWVVFPVPHASVAQWRWCFLSLTLCFHSAKVVCCFCSALGVGGSRVSHRASWQFLPLYPSCFHQKTETRDRPRVTSRWESQHPDESSVGITATSGGTKPVAFHPWVDSAWSFRGRHKVGSLLGERKF